MVDYFLKLARFCLYGSIVSFLVIGASAFFQSFLGNAVPFLSGLDMFFPFIVGKAMFFRTAIELAALFYLSYLFIKNPKEEWDEIAKLAQNPIAIAVTLFTAAFLLVSFTAVVSQFAIWSNFERGEGAIQIIHYWAFFVLSLLILKTKRSWLNFMTWFIAIGVLVSLYAVGQKMSFLGAENGIPPQKNLWINYVGAAARPSGTLGNPLYLSTFVMFCLFFLIILFKDRAQLWGKIFLGLAAVFLLPIMVLTQSRNGFSGVLGGLAVLLAYYGLKGGGIKLKLGASKKIPARPIALAILIAIIVTSSIFYFTRTSNVCVQNLGNGQLAESLVCSKLPALWQNFPIVNRFAKDRLLAGLDDRTWVWGAALAGFLDKPILGWGPENFPIPFDKYYNPKHFGNDSWFDRAHNTYLEYLVDGGLVLFSAYLLIWAALVYELKKHKEKLTFFTFGLIISFVVAYLIQGISAFEVLPIYISLYAFLGFMVRLLGDSEAEKTARAPKLESARPVPLTHYLGLLAATIILAAIFYFSNILPFNKNVTLLALATSRSNNLDRINEGYKKELEMPSPIGEQESVQYYLMFVTEILDNLLNSHKFTVTPQTSKIIENLAEQADSVYLKYENSPYRAIGTKSLYFDGSIFLKAGMLTNNGALINKARERLEEGLSIAPTRMEFIYSLLDLALYKKDAATAKLLLARAKLLRPDLQNNQNYQEAFDALEATTSKIK